MQKRTRDPIETRRALVAATTQLMMRQGFATTTVDQICEESGLTKGSFFHHFDSKEAIGLAAMASFAEMGMALYRSAVVTRSHDPLAPIHRLFDAMGDLVATHQEQLTCMVGMLSQELALSNTTVREAGAEHMTAWVDFVADLLTQAKRAARPRRRFDPKQVAWMIYSVWQGSMLLAKTMQTPTMVKDNLRQARDYVDSLFAETQDERE